MSISCKDIEPADRDGVLAASTSIRMEGPNGKYYVVLCNTPYPWLVPVAENVQRLLWFENNWDSHGALPVNPIAIQGTFSVLSHIMDESKPVPRLSPTPSGGIQLEWREPNLLFQIEIEYDAQISAFLSDTRCGAGLEWEDEELNDLSILADKSNILKRVA